MIIEQTQLFLYPTSITVAISWCTRDRQGRHPAPGDNLRASGSFELLVF